MKSNVQRIYNTISLQEIIVVCLIGLLFVAQPFSGIARVPLFALTGVGLFLALRDKEKMYRIPLCQLGIITLLFLIPGILSYWNTYNVEKTNGFMLIMFAFFFTGLTMLSAFWNERCFKLLIATIALTSSFWILDAIYQFCFAKDLLGVPMRSGELLSGPFTDSTHLGMLLVVLMPVTLSWLEKITWYFPILFLLGLGFVLILADVRTDLVSFLIAVFLYYIWTKTGIKTLFLVLVPMILILAGTTILVNQNQSQRLRSVQSVVNFLATPLSYKKANQLLSGRLDIWATGWEMTKGNPLTGVGAKAFNFAFEEYKVNNRLHVVDGKGGPFHAHHPWITILAETGFIGITGFIGVIVLLFGITARTRWGINLHTYPWLLSFVLLINPLNSMPPLFKTWWFPIVLLVIVAHLVDVAKKNTT